jgi:hypothetical protein
MVERTFQFTPDDGGEPRPITLTVHAPILVGDRWDVTLEIQGFPGERHPTLHGGDSMQAFLLALQFADFRLRSLARIYRGKLTLDGNTSLGLISRPIGWRSRLVRTIAELLGDRRD